MGAPTLSTRRRAGHRRPAAPSPPPSEPPDRFEAAVRIVRETAETIRWWEPVPRHLLEEVASRLRPVELRPAASDGAGPVRGWWLPGTAEVVRDLERRVPRCGRCGGALGPSPRCFACAEAS